jgi:hypothetical protein
MLVLWVGLMSCGIADVWEHDETAHRPQSMELPLIRQARPRLQERLPEPNSPALRFSTPPSLLPRTCQAPALQIDNAITNKLQRTGYLPASVAPGDISEKQRMAAYRCFYREKFCDFKPQKRILHDVLERLASVTVRRVGACEPERNPQLGLFSQFAPVAEAGSAEPVTPESSAPTTLPPTGPAETMPTVTPTAAPKPPVDTSSQTETPAIAAPPAILAPVKPEIDPPIAPEKPIGPKVYLVESLNCRPPFEAYFLAYKVNDDEKDAPDATPPPRIEEKHIVWFNASREGESDEGWLCAPAQRFCHGAVEFDSFTANEGDRLKNDAISPEEKTSLISFEAMLESLETRGLNECRLRTK